MPGIYFILHGLRILCHCLYPEKFASPVRTYPGCVRCKPLPTCVNKPNGFRRVLQSRAPRLDSIRSNDRPMMAATPLGTQSFPFWLIRSLVLNAARMLEGGFRVWVGKQGTGKWVVNGFPV